MKRAFTTDDDGQRFTDGRPGKLEFPLTDPGNAEPGQAILWYDTPDVRGVAWRYVHPAWVEPVQAQAPAAAGGKRRMRVTWSERTTYAVDIETDLTAEQLQDNPDDGNGEAVWFGLVEQQQKDWPMRAVIDVTERDVQSIHRVAQDYDDAAADHDASCDGTLQPPVSSEPTNPMLPAADGGSVCAYCGATVERGVVCCERMRAVLDAVGARLLDAGEP